MSTLAVVEGILRDAAVPLSVREIVERAGELLPTKSKTPDTVVARDLSMDIKKKGEGSLFVRTSPGRYAIREQVMRQGSAGIPVSAPVAISRTEEVATPVIGQSLAERAPTRPATKPPTDVGGEEMSA